MTAATPRQALFAALEEAVWYAYPFPRNDAGPKHRAAINAAVDKALAAADDYARPVEAELSALADRLGAAIRAAAAGERERIRDLAVRSGAVCREVDGTPHPFAGLIGEDPGMFRGRPGDGEGGGG